MSTTPNGKSGQGIKENIPVPLSEQKPVTVTKSGLWGECAKMVKANTSNIYTECAAF